MADAAGSAGKTLFDAVKARKNADVDELEREKKRLELKAAIQKLEAGEAIEGAESND
jgi:hypothetical protein